MRGSKTKRFGSFGSIDRRADPVRISCAERLDPSEDGQHAVSRAIERLVEFEVVTVSVHEGHLAGECQRFGAKRVDVIRIRIP